MVKSIFRILLPILWACAAYGCGMDLGGLFASTDLDTRLKEKNNSGSSSRPSPLTLGDEYSFIVITDIHMEKGNTYGLEKIKTVIEGNTEIKFAVFCGDITQNGSEQDLGKFLEITGDLPIPSYSVIGNHDIFFGNWSVWNKLIGPTRYRVDGDSATLFMLDSANAFLGKEQIDWLENELKSAKGRVFVFSHHNLFRKPMTDIQQLSDTKERARLISLLRGKCDMMITGHSHERMINEAGGVQYISVDKFSENKIYCLVTVSKTGISYEFKKVESGE